MEARNRKSAKEVKEKVAKKDELPVTRLKKAEEKIEVLEKEVEILNKTIETIYEELRAKSSE